MATYKCRKCGAPLMPQEDQITAVCQSCGNLLRLPRVDQALYNRANELRMEKRFDQAAAMFRECVSQDPQDAECHWNLLLCKFGVEYVKDEDGSLIPTCNGITYDPILEDEDYQDAVRFADEISARIYESEAQRLQVIQQEIIKLSQKSEEFDVFISYKETDAEGGRTEDSVMAHTIYEELTKKGYKVFFSRVTLKGQAGLKYEPIIFSALNSAPVMLLIGTSKENLESVWVKNEWTRFLHLMEEDKDKKIEVVYKGMERIDLPAKLRFVPQRKISANDKFGWHQDVAYDVDSMLAFRKKDKIQGGFIRETDEEANSRAINNLYIRYEQLMEEGKNDQAKECLVQALDIDYEYAETWWRLLACESKHLTYLGNEAKPDAVIWEYAENVRKFANESQKQWVEAIAAYYKKCEYHYGDLCFENMQKLMKSSTNYSSSNQERIYAYHEKIQQYAFENVKEQATAALRKWEEKLPILEEYQQKIADTTALHNVLKQNDKKYNDFYEMVERDNKKTRKLIQKPLIFGFSNVVMLIYILIGPVWAAFLWQAEGATDGPFTGWSAFGSILCLVGYIIGVGLTRLFCNRRDNRKQELLYHAAFPVIGIVVFTIIGEVNQYNLYTKIAQKFGITLTWVMGDPSRESMVELFTIAQPFLRKFCFVLLILIALHILLALRKHGVANKIDARINANKSNVAELNRMTADAVKKFHEYYVNELGADNLSEQKVRSEIQGFNKRYYL